MDYNKVIQIFAVIGEAFNSSIKTTELLGRAAQTITENLSLKGCHFRILSRDQKILENAASYGLSRRFLDKGPVDAEVSMTEALEGRTVSVLDCAVDPRIQYPAEHAAEGIVSCVTVPLATRGQVIGTMRLFMGEKREISAMEKQIAEIVASFATRAITHAMFHAILDNVTESVRASLDLNTVLDRIAEQICEDLRAKGATIHLYDTHGELIRRTGNGLDETYLKNVGDRIVAEVAPHMDGECVQIYDAARDERTPDAEVLRQQGVCSQLFVPLMVREQCLGVLGLYTHHPYLFSEDEIYFMKSIGDHCAMAIQNARMYAALERQYEDLMNDFQMWFGQRHQLKAQKGES
jgi:GAF domain-containing protein